MHAKGVLKDPGRPERMPRQQPAWPSESSPDSRRGAGAWVAEPDSPSVPERVPRQQPGFARLRRSRGARAPCFTRSGAAGSIRPRVPLPFAVSRIHQWGLNPTKGRASGTQIMKGL